MLARKLIYKTTPLIELPATLLSASLANTTQLFTDFLIPLTFVIGAIVLFKVAPRIVGWFSKIGK